ncbi:hypothetical protein OK074_8344 [Actinobacteria bacterium OK074]|nr:hypothetical protein OK074_8344 [Actinobacteria bacterium OK074]
MTISATRVPRGPNVRLRTLLAEADYTLDALARAVNARGAQEGRHLSYDRSAVAHWLRGAAPKPPVPRYVTEVLGHRTGRCVTLTEAGFPDDGHPLPPDEDPTATLHRLAAYGTGELRTTAVRHLPLPSALVRPPTAAESAPAAPATALGARRAGAVRSHVRHCADGFDTFGGDYGRTALAAYAADTVLPWLRVEPGRRDRELLRETSRLAFLLGRMHTDSLLHGAAQQYHLAALRLAAEAGDAGAWAMVMSTLSAQAEELGHLALARQTAEAAAQCTGRLGSAQRAFVHAQLGVARALEGDGVGARRVLRAAEAQAREAAGGPGAFPTYHYTAYAYRVGVALWLLQDRGGAIGAWRLGLERCGATHRRAVALSHSRTAQALLQVGRLSEACRHWDALGRMREEVRAGIVLRAVDEARGALAPFAGYADAEVVLRRIGRAEQVR